MPPGFPFFLPVMNLAYDTHGSVDNPPLLLLHGFMGCAADWEVICQHFSRRYFCICPDLPGHGRSLACDDEQPWDMSNTAAWVVDLLDELRIERASLLGYSMGGRLALGLAIWHPSRCNKIILESASPGLASAGEREQRKRDDEMLACKIEGCQSLGDFLEEWYQKPIFAGITQTPSFEELLQRRLCNTPGALARSLREMGTGVQPNLWPHLKAMKLPLLLVIGEKDVKFDAISARMAAENMRFRRRIIPGCGHNCHHEQPAEFLEGVTRFLEEK